jgi:hypothetical protein
MGSDTREAMPGGGLPTTDIHVASGAPSPGRFPDAGAIPVLVTEHTDDLRNVRRVTTRLPLRIISPDGVLDVTGRVMKQEDILAELAAGTQKEDPRPLPPGAPARG